MKKDKTLANIKNSLNDVKKYQAEGDFQMAEICQSTADVLIRMVTVFRGMTKDEVLSKVASI